MVCVEHGQWANFWQRKKHSPQDYLVHSATAGRYDGQSGVTVFDSSSPFVSQCSDFSPIWNGERILRTALHLTSSSTYLTSLFLAKNWRTPQQVEGSPSKLDENSEKVVCTSGRAYQMPWRVSNLPNGSRSSSTEKRMWPLSRKAQGCKRVEGWQIRSTMVPIQL